jgi:hypothetical protein
MEDYRYKLKKQLTEIDELISRIEKDLSKLKNLPDSRIIVTKSNGCDQYYWLDKETKSRKYAKVEEMQALKNVAQRDYEMEISKKLKRNREEIIRFLKKYNVDEIETIYSRMADARKKLIIPVVEPNELFVEKWKNVEYEPMPIFDDTEFYSNNGIRVRSKSELIIANLLEQKEIPYRYEYQINLRGVGTVRPDFMCLNIRTREEFIWEHFGMMDSVKYANKTVEKINSYEQNGYFPGKNLIMTFETSQCAISSNIIQKTIDKYLI